MAPEKHQRVLVALGVWGRRLSDDVTLREHIVILHLRREHVQIRSDEVRRQNRSEAGQRSGQACCGASKGLVRHLADKDPSALLQEDYCRIGVGLRKYSKGPLVLVAIQRIAPATLAKGGLSEGGSIV